MEKEYSELNIVLMERMEVQDMTISQGEVRMLNEILHSPITRAHENQQTKVVYEQSQPCVLSEPPMLRGNNTSYSTYPPQCNIDDNGCGNIRTTPHNIEYIINDKTQEYEPRDISNGQEERLLNEPYAQCEYSKLDQRQVYQMQNTPGAQYPIMSINGVFSEQSISNSYKQVNDVPRALPPILSTPLGHSWGMGSSALYSRYDPTSLSQSQQERLQQEYSSSNELHRSSAQQYPCASSFQESMPMIHHSSHQAYNQSSYQYQTMQEQFLPPNVHSQRPTSMQSPSTSSDISTDSPHPAEGLKKPPRTCKFADCMKTIQRHGLCHKHGGVRKCTKEGCTRKDRGEGFCVAHGGGKRCAHQGCEKVVRRGVYCLHHSGPSSSVRAA